MTFDEWWPKQDLSKISGVPKILILAFREIAKKGWDAACNCPICGKDLKLPYCPNNHKEGQNDERLG